MMLSVCLMGFGGVAEKLGDNIEHLGAIILTVWFEAIWIVLHGA